jgi:hypothetical protein
MSYKKVGGLHFVKVWRVSVSFCLTKPKHAPAKRTKCTKPVLLGMDHLAATCTAAMITTYLNH